MAGRVCNVLVCFGFVVLWRRFVVLTSRSPVWVFVCHARS